jgi:tRNA(Ile)-lysidine synthetase-like protein
MPAGFIHRISEAMSSAGVATQDRLLVAFSGGRDSVALVEALLEAGFKKLVLLYLDHALREESAAEGDWVGAYARTRGLDFVVERIPVATLAAERQKGLEETARDARYAFFVRTATQNAVSKLALAHHADDQIETLIFRLLRGAGTGGLSAMAPESKHHAGDFTLTLLRPMLGIWRSEINAYIERRGAAFLEDPSNASHDFARNRIRHILIPEMERVMRRPVREALWRTADILRAEAEFGAHAEKALGAVTESLGVAELRTLPTALRRRRIARWLAMQGVPDIGYEIVEAVSQLALRLKPSKVNLPKGAFARRKAGRIFYMEPPLAPPSEA